VEWQVLGPLGGRDQGERIPLGGARQRALLAVLLLSANEVDSTDRMTELVTPVPPAQHCRSRCTKTCRHWKPGSPRMGARRRRT
jgi:hypothetical protein